MPIEVYGDIIVWITPDMMYTAKIEITDQDGTVYDLTSKCLNPKVTWGLNGVVSTFSARLPDPRGDYATTFTGGETIKVYLERGIVGSPTTQIFQGTLEMPGKTYEEGVWLNFLGKGDENTLQNTKVTISFENVEASEMVTTLFTTYAPTYSLSGIETTSGRTATIEFSDDNLTDCLKEISDKCGVDIRINPGKTVDLFVQGSQTNSDEGIVHGQTLVEIGSFGPDRTRVFNKIRVYGKSTEEIPLIGFSEDISSQTDYGARELRVTDNNLTTNESVQERSEKELSIRKVPPTIGEVVCFCNYTLKPGQKVYVSAPLSEINSLYRVVQVEHVLNSEFGVKTTATIERDAQNFSVLFQNQIREIKRTKVFDNPNDMNYSWLFTFDDSYNISGLSGAVINSSALISTIAGGYAITTTRTLSTALTSLQLSASGNDLANTEFYYSLDGGASYTQISNGAVQTITDPGLELVIKVIFNAADIAVTTLAILYK